MKISGTQIDPENIDPKSYDNLLMTLTKQNEMLEVIQQILNVGAGHLDKIESYWREKGIEINNISIKGLFASRAEDITDKTVCFVGYLDYNEYEKVNPNAKNLPDSLKIVLGSVVALDSDITAVDLVFVEDLLTIRRCKNLLKVEVQSSRGGADVRNNPKLKSVTINGAKITVVLDTCTALESAVFGISQAKIFFPNCSELQELTLDSLEDDLYLLDCPKLKLDQIHSYTGKKIVIPEDMSVREDFVRPSETDVLGNFNYTWDKHKYIKNRIVKKFVVNKENILIEDLT